MRAISIFLLALALAACGSGSRTNVLVPDASPSFALMDFSAPLPLDPLPPGWHHRKFMRTPPMDISFASKEGRPAIRLATNASASMLYRYVDVGLDAFPALAWDWFVEQPIASDMDETTIAGDDHPARLYLKFESSDGKSHAMEIIWGNRRLKTGDWKYLDFFWGLRRFPHYVANAGDANAGRWHDQEVDMRELYRAQWGDPSGARLVEIALFCDTDQTGARSIAYFSRVRVNRATESDKRATWLAAGEFDLRLGGRIRLEFENSKLSRDKVAPPKYKGREMSRFEGVITQLEKEYGAAL